MENLKKYPFINEDLNKILMIKLLSEFYFSLNSGKAFLREPHCLEKNLDKIEFYEKETKENIEKYIKSILECHSYLKKEEELLENLSKEDYIELLSVKGLFNQEIDRGQYNLISLKIIQMLDKYTSIVFTTPEIIGDIFSKILRVKPNETCFDFAYGKGKLALQVGNTKIYGMEKNEYNKETANLLLKISNKEGEVIQGDSLEDEIKEADVVISDPPFRLNILPKDNKEYLKWGSSLRSSDLAFLSLAIFKAKSRGAMIVPQGVLFNSGNEGKVRESIIKDGHIEGIISLPNNILSYTGIPVSIIFFRKDKFCDKIFMLDATKSFFEKIRGGVTINEENLERIVKIYNNFEEVENISKFVDIKEIIDNNQGVLTVGRYIETKIKKIDVKSLIKKMDKNLEIAKNYKEESDKILKKLMEA